MEKKYQPKKHSTLNEFDREQANQEHLEVIKLLRAYNIKSVSDVVFNLTHEFRTKSGLSDFFTFNNEKEYNEFVPPVNIYEAYSVYTDKQKTKNELHELAQIIESIEAGNVQKWEIQIKINKGKLSKQTITIGHKENLSLIIKQLKQLPKGEPMPKKGKGSPEQKQYKQFMKEAVRRCYEIIEPTDPELTETDKLFFAGMVLTLAGIIAPPSSFNEGFEFESNQLQDYKKKLSDFLKHYKPTKK